MTKDEALRLALEALENLGNHDHVCPQWPTYAEPENYSKCNCGYDQAITAIKAALEAKCEPVVWNEGVPAMLPKQKEGETFIVSYEPKLEAKDEPVAQWQKKHATKTEGKWENTNGPDARWWLNNSVGWEIRALYTHPPQQEAKDEPVAWISVKDELPKAVRGVSYKSSLTDTVLVLHSDRPDYPITAHAVVGEGLGAGVAIPTDGASEHPEIAWYSASCNLNNPFNLKNDDYERFLPKIFGKKITHWMPIPTTPPQRKPLTDEQIMEALGLDGYDSMAIENARAIEAAHGIKEEA